MKIHQTNLPGVVVVESVPFIDHRGTFKRLFCSQELSKIIAKRHIVQINHSITAAIGAVRGMHYQLPPHAEMKLVRCLKGRIWDVAVDLRTNSPTFLQWYAEELSPESNRMLVIPEGCAHGFQALEANSEVLYLHTEFFQSSAQAGLAYNDPRLNIQWPLPVTDLSERDRKHAFIDSDFAGITP